MPPLTISRQQFSGKEIPMWTCPNCGISVISAISRRIDADGRYFICPACGYRNILISVDGEGDSITVEQSLAA
jgi:predicted RNA-binding Zn-ribbon protein involved in translation (DUF1610 family)